MFRKYLILIFIIFCSTKFYAQEIITENEYLRLDSILWVNYENQQKQLFQCEDNMPDKKDSIQEALYKLHEEASHKNIELAIKYASVPSGLRRLYMVRLDLSKDTLNSILKSLNSDMQNSFYGRNIQAHLQTEQIVEGDTIQSFPCIQDNGKTFDWSVCKGKQLLMLYGGLGCMGEGGRKELKQLYETTSRDDLLVIVYWPCGSLKDLQETKQYYSAEYIFISDFKRDDSPIKIKYGTQAMPTCFLTDKDHRVVVKCLGLNTQLIQSHIQYTR